MKKTKKKSVGKFKKYLYHTSSQKQIIDPLEKKWYKFIYKINKLPRILKTFLYSLTFALIGGIISVLITYFVSDGSFQYTFEKWIPAVIFVVVFVLVFVIDFIQFLREFE